MESDNQDSSSTSTPTTEKPTPPTTTDAPAPTSSTAPSPTPTPNPKSKFASKFAGIKKLGTVPLVIIAAVILFGGGAAAYFAVIVPNKPENVWNKAMQNTGKGLDRFIAYSKENKDVKGAKFNGTFRFESSGVVADGSFDGQVYDKNGKFKADIGAAGARINVELLTNVPDGATNPDIYLKAKGLSSIGAVLGAEAPEVSQIINQVDNQWFLIDHTLLDQYEAMAAGQQESTMPQFSPEDIYAIEEAIAKATKEHLLATTPDKASLKVVKYVGKEELDGRKTYHYVVGFNKDQLKDYVSALKSELKNTKIKDIIESSGMSYDEAFSLDELNKGIDGIDDEKDTVDVWVDMSTKLIRKIRITDEDNDKNYVDLMLNYNGGSKYPFVIDFHGDDKDGSGTMSFKTELDTAKDSVDFTFDLDMKFDGETTKANVKLALEQSDEKVDFTKPADAISIYDFLGQYMQGLQGLGGTNALPTSSDSPLGNFDL